MILDLIEKIKKEFNCEVFEKDGIPKIEMPYVLPKDLEMFYEKCGGMVLFKNSDYPFRILTPKEFAKANPIILGEEVVDDMTNDWFVIASDMNGEYITIDLNEKRNGRCYDSYYDRHGVPGDCSIVVKNFTELLNFLYENKGDYLFWLKEDFVFLGDAYENQ